MLDINLISDYNFICPKSDYFLCYKKLCHGVVSRQENKEEHKMKESIVAQMAEYNQLMKSMDGLYHNAARKCGLSDSAFWTLYSIKESEEPCTQKELCESWFYSKQTVNSTLKQLEEKGILKLELAPGSRKNKRILLTEEGERLAEEKVIPLMEAECRVLACFDAEDCRAFLDLTRKYTDQLRAELEKM